MGIIGNLAGIRASFVVIPVFLAILLAIVVIDTARHGARTGLRR
jgi:hypothetical protein